MENQHRKIAGYRELSAEEIDLMNRIKAVGSDLVSLQGELSSALRASEIALFNAIDSAKSEDERAIAQGELVRFQNAEPHRWASIGKTDIQTGVMAMVRAVAQPGGGI